MKKVPQLSTNIISTNIKIKKNGVGISRKRTFSAHFSQLVNVFLYALWMLAFVDLAAAQAQTWIFSGTSTGGDIDVDGDGTTDGTWTMSNTSTLDGSAASFKDGFPISSLEESGVSEGGVAFEYSVNSGNWDLNSVFTVNLFDPDIKYKLTLFGNNDGIGTNAGFGSKFSSYTLNWTGGTGSAVVKDPWVATVTCTSEKQIDNVVDSSQGISFEQTSAIGTCANNSAGVWKNNFLEWFVELPPRGGTSSELSLSAFGGAQKEGFKFAVISDADLVVENTVADTELAVGEESSYTITITNAGDSSQSAAIDVAIAHPLPSEVTISGTANTSGTGDNTGGSYDAGTNTWSIGKLKVGESATLVIPFTVNSGITAGTVVTSSIDPASITTPQTDPVDNHVSLDASFTVIEIASQSGKDYGDAPDNEPYDYKQASHDISASPDLYLGNTPPDSEDGTSAPSSDSTGDDDANVDDEDAFVALPNVLIADPSIPDLSLGRKYSLNVPVTNNTGAEATLHAWIDFNKNGKFEEGEYQTVPVNGEDSVSLSWDIPLITSVGDTHARFRLTTDDLGDNRRLLAFFNLPSIPILSVLNSTILNLLDGIDGRSVGNAIDGEVEDYPVSISLPLYDYGDAPDASSGTLPGDYQTTQGDDGPSHIVLDTLGLGLSLGSKVDGDDGSLQNENADADDLDSDNVELLNNGNTNDDEDGVDIANLPPLTADAGQTYTVPVVVRNTIPLLNAYLKGYIDFNRDGDFNDAGEKSVTVTVPPVTSVEAGVSVTGSSTSASASVNENELRTVNVTFTVPAGVIPGTTYARFRLGSIQEIVESATTLSVSALNGEVNNGEVEDYKIEIAAATNSSNTESTDYGDAPNPYDSASHDLVADPNLYIGNVPPDGEASTRLTSAASAGDDDDGNDDEDGFVALPNVPLVDPTVTELSVGRNYELTVPVTNNTSSPATLHAWIDFNQNNKFEPEEYQSAPVNPGDSEAPLNWNTFDILGLGALTVPLDTLAGDTYARFRLTSNDLSDTARLLDIVPLIGVDERSIGNATDGEVEDHPVSISLPLYDYGDAPDTRTGTSKGNYRTTESDGGPTHLVIQDPLDLLHLSLGNNIDADRGDLQNADADADDTNTQDDDLLNTIISNGDTGLDDEDGVVEFPLLTAEPGQTYTVPVTVRNNVPLLNAYLKGYIDFNQDGDFDDPGEKSATVTVPSDLLTVTPSLNLLDTVGLDTTGAPRTFNVEFTVPNNVVPGNTYARFRLGSIQEIVESATSLSVSTSNGEVNNGEVEDYGITIASQTAAVGGKLINDTNYNGIQDPGETPLENVELKLLDLQNDVREEVTTTTNEDGSYSFEDLPTGEYTVEIELPDKTVLRPLEADNGGIGSSFNRITNQTESLVLEGGDSLNLNAAIAPDSDGDKIADANEPGDRDGDGVADSEEIDPAGFFYDESNGRILTGGSISVEGPSAGSVNLVDDGADGSYQFFGREAGVYTMTINSPPGYEPSTACTETAGPFDPTGGPDPTSLGSGENATTGFLVDYDCADNIFYLSFNLEAGDPFVINNNLPFKPIPNFLPPTTRSCPTGLADFADWTGGASGSGNFTASGSNLPVLPNFTYTVTGNNNGTAINNSEPFDGANQFELVYGQADSAENLNVGVRGNNGSIGSPIDSSTLLTITFDENTPSSGWAFHMHDFDDDQATIIAKDINGNEVSNTIINSWLIELFDPNPSDDGNNLPVWDSANATVVGAGNSGVNTRTETIRDVDNSVEAPGVWFQPNIALSELSIQFESVTRVEASYHLYLASCLSEQDYGDAPDTYGDASHQILPSPTLYLGGIDPDSEIDTQLGGDAGAAAAGDDNDGNDDDDAFPSLADISTVGSYSLDVPLTNTSGVNATLHGWVDFNQNGTFEAGEYKSVRVRNNDPSARLAWNVPSGTTPGNTHVRLRLTTDSLRDNNDTTNLDERSIGNANDGEVEDYPVAIADSPLNPNSLDYGDAPDPSGGANQSDYQTRQADNGASHVIDPNLYIGTIPDADDGLLEDVSAEADDDDNNRDEGDIVFDLLSATDTNYQINNISVTNDTNQDAYLVGWIDFDQNGSFDPDEAATVAVPSTGTQNVDLDWNTIPLGMQSGTTYARFRLTTDNTIATGTANTSIPIDEATDGEVEDYQVRIVSSNFAYNSFCYYSDKFEWSDYASGGLPVSVGGITINGAVVNTFFPNGTSSSHSIDTGTQGGESGNYNLSMGFPNTTTAGDYFDFQYTFNPGITDLSFRLIDVDRGGWIDIATVTAFYQGNPVPVTLTAEGSAVSVSGNTATGTAPSLSTQTLGNVRVDITDPVDTVNIRYEAGSSLASQFIWIGDFGLCNSDYSDNPASYGEARHTTSVNSSLHLGSLAPDDDRATTSLASAAADGDDIDNEDDEDAFTTLDSISIASTATHELTVPVTNTTGGSAVLHGWIDFNKDGIFSADEHQAVVVPDAATTADISWTIPDGTTSGSTFTRFRITTDNLADDATTEIDERSIGANNNGEVEDYPVPIATDPNLLLVKRITAINPQSDNTQFNNFVNDSTENDNNPNWPGSQNNGATNTYTIGTTDGGLVKPKDEVEYTIYFLSSGNDPAQNVLVCDLIPENMEFVSSGFESQNPASGGLPGAARGILWEYNGAVQSLTNGADGDAGYYFPPGEDPRNVFPNIKCGDPHQPNTNGAVVINLGELDPATAPGTPTNSYGFIRFRAKVQ